MLPSPAPGSAWHLHLTPCTAPPRPPAAAAEMSGVHDFIFQVHQFIFYLPGSEIDEKVMI